MLKMRTYEVCLKNRPGKKSHFTAPDTAGAVNLSNAIFTRFTTEDQFGAASVFQSK